MPEQSHLSPVVSNLYAPKLYPEDESTFNLVPLGNLDQYLKDKDTFMAQFNLGKEQIVAEPKPVLPEAPFTTAEPVPPMHGLPENVQEFFSSLLALAASNAFEKKPTVGSQEIVTSLKVEKEVPIQASVSAPKIIKTSEMYRKFSDLPRNKKLGIAAVTLTLAGVTAATNLGNNYLPSSLEFGITATQPVAVAFPKPIVLGSMELQSEATLHIPIAGFPRPLMFSRDSKKVEPTAAIGDTVDLTLTPLLDKNGKALPFVIKSKDGGLVVNRKNVSVVSTFKDYNGLDVNCGTQNIAHRYCVAAAPTKLTVGGPVTEEIAKKLNNLMLPDGSDFSKYYHGTKAKLVVASLSEVSQNDCGNKIMKLGDAVLTGLLNAQYPKNEVSFADGKYPLLSPNYNNTFSRDYATTDLTIERGDAKNSIADSLALTCTVASATKGA